MSDLVVFALAEDLLERPLPDQPAPLESVNILFGTEPKLGGSGVPQNATPQPCSGRWKLDLCAPLLRPMRTRPDEHEADRKEAERRPQSERKLACTPYDTIEGSVMTRNTACVGGKEGMRADV